MHEIHHENLLQRRYGFRSRQGVDLLETRNRIVMNANPYAIMLSDPQPAAAGAKSGVKPSTGASEDTFSECMPNIGNYDEEWISFVEHHSMESCWASRDRDEPDVLPRVWNLPHF